MKTTMFRSAGGLLLAGILLSVLPASAGELKPGVEPPNATEGQPTKVHEHALAALRVERDKLAAGKSTLFAVCGVAKQVRDAELRMSTTAPQRMAAHNRHVSVLKELKSETERRVETGVVAPLELKLVTQELEQADNELVRSFFK